MEKLLDKEDTTVARDCVLTNGSTSITKNVDNVY